MKAFASAKCVARLYRSNEDTTTTDAPMDIDEVAIRKRFTQFRNAWAEKASMKSRSATYVLFTKFLQSRSRGTASRMEDTQPKDVVEFLCWLDSCGTRRRTVYTHATEQQSEWKILRDVQQTRESAACDTRSIRSDQIIYQSSPWCLKKNWGS